MRLVFDRYNVELESMDNFTCTDYSVLLAVVSGVYELIFKVFSTFFITERRKVTVCHSMHAVVNELIVGI